jgi:hypothetical protein
MGDPRVSGNAGEVAREFVRLETQWQAAKR